MCHVLYCSLCCSYFQVYLHEFCSFHPQDPEFPNIQFKNSTQPFGSYPCCMKPVNRFQPLPPNIKGCQSRDHRVKVKSAGPRAIADTADPSGAFSPPPLLLQAPSSPSPTSPEPDYESETYRILMKHRDLICVCPLRKSGVKGAVENNSICLPVPLSM